MKDDAQVSIDVMMATKALLERDIRLGLVSENQLRYRLIAGDAKKLALELHADGISSRKIGKAIGVSHQTVINWVGEDESVNNLTENAKDLTAPSHEENAVELPKETYGTIVIDPPWDMEKIERQVRRKQTGFDYPTMTEDELAAFKLPAADDCHLFCWTTQKFLPAALRLTESWGFKYIFLMTWYKPGGFQPHGLPQYNSEFVVYARRGAARFTDTQAFNTCFQGERRQHSRKPDVFYDTVRRVTPDGRIDIFSREKRAGFEQYGNEVSKFEAAE